MDTAEKINGISGKTLIVFVTNHDELVYKAYWRIADSYILHRSLTNEYLASVGYDDILERYKALHLSY